MLKCENLPRTNSTKLCEIQNILVKFQQNEHTPGIVLKYPRNIWGYLFKIIRQIAQDGGGGRRRARQGAAGFSMHDLPKI